MPETPGGGPEREVQAETSEVHLVLNPDDVEYLGSTKLGDIGEGKAVFSHRFRATLPAGFRLPSLGNLISDFGGEEEEEEPEEA